MVESVVVLAVVAVLLVAVVVLVVVGVHRRREARLIGSNAREMLRAGGDPERDAAIGDAVRGRGANTGLNF